VALFPLSGEEIKISSKYLANLFTNGGFEISLGASEAFNLFMSFSDDFKKNSFTHYVLRT
jgi:hypothetical protein